MFRWRVQVIGAVAAFIGVLASGQAQQRAKGQELFEKRCGGCHALDLDKEGPRLRGVYGRRAGSLDSFQYSDALKKSKVIWNDELLRQWLTDPQQLVPDNDMAFHLENAGEHREIIAYLKQSSGK
jgi:cytochrome c